MRKEKDNENDSATCDGTNAGVLQFKWQTHRGMIECLYDYKYKMKRGINYGVHKEG